MVQGKHDGSFHMFQSECLAGLILRLGSNLKLLSCPLFGKLFGEEKK